MGFLWYGSWKDYKKIREMYNIDIMVSIARYPPYRYYGSVEKTSVLDFRHLGPSRELHRWRREEVESKRDTGALWTEYAGKYSDEIGNREIDGKTDKQYNMIINWVKQGLNVCLLCTCKAKGSCHRFLLWNNMVRIHRLPYRGGRVVLDFPERFLDKGKVTDKTWEWNAIDFFAEQAELGINKLALACPHVEASAAYDRLIKRGLFGSDGPYLFLKDTALEMINVDERL